eukprot:1976563-Pleurochrysis_carterae.AAC.4
MQPPAGLNQALTIFNCCPSVWPVKETLRWTQHNSQQASSRQNACLRFYLMLAKLRRNLVVVPPRACNPCKNGCGTPHRFTRSEIRTRGVGLSTKDETLHVFFTWAVVAVCSSTRGSAPRAVRLLLRGT